MYRLEPDLHNPGLMYIYQDTENSTRIKLTVYRDIDLARRIVEELNRKEYSSNDNEELIKTLKEEEVVEVSVQE